MMFRRRLSRKRAWLGLMILCALALQAQAQLAPRVIHRIIITNVGPQNVSESIVRANIHVKEGDPFQPAGLNDDVPNLYATGFFSDIKVTAEETVAGVDITYYLTAKSKLSDIQVTGNRKY